MNTLCSGRRIAYDGSQLRSGWLAETFGLDLDAAAAFTGACDVKPEHMIDLEDLAANERIVAREMLHFIVEHEACDLERAALRQRLFIVCVLEALLARGVAGLRREGDDLFIDEWEGEPPGEPARQESRPPRKLSVSVATRSASGTGLIHAGLNIDQTGAPVPAIGLAELGIKPPEFAEDVLRRYAAETDGVTRAAAKVRPCP